MSQGTAGEQAARLAARVEPQVNRLARRVIERQRAEVPGFDRLPSGVRDVEIAATVRHGFRGFLRHAQGLAETDTAVFRERAVQRAEEGVPLVWLIRSYAVAAEVLLEALTAVTGAGEEAALQELTRRQMRAQAAIVALVAEAYLAGMGEQRAGARELAWALVRGDRPAEVAARYDLPLEGGYLVLGVRAAEGPEPVAGRGALRRLVARLAPLAGGRVLVLHDEGGGYLLLPAGVSPDGVRARLAGGPEAGVVVGAATAVGVADVPAAAERARRIAAVAGGPGVFEIRDVLLDYHLTNASDGAGELVAVLEPLDRHVGLVETLRAFLDGDLDRRRAARALGVHANTIDNRLTRVAALTGVDPRGTAGVRIFGAALAVRRLAGPVGGGTVGAVQA